jgi:hypothetical protein
LDKRWCHHRRSDKTQQAGLIAAARRIAGLIA